MEEFWCNWWGQLLSSNLKLLTWSDVWISNFKIIFQIDHSPPTFLQKQTTSITWKFYLQTKRTIYIFVETFFPTSKNLQKLNFDTHPQKCKKNTTTARAARARDGHANIPRPTTSVASLPLHQLLHRFPSWRGLKGPPPPGSMMGPRWRDEDVYIIYIYTYPITDPWDWYVFPTWRVDFYEKLVGMEHQLKMCTNFTIWTVFIWKVIHVRLHPGKINILNPKTWR